MTDKIKSIFSVFLILCIAAFGIYGMSGCDIDDGSVTKPEVTNPEITAASTEKNTMVPEYSSSSYISLNDNNPEFKEEELSVKSYEYYSPLDELGRCGVAVACVGKDLMPTEERGAIGQVKPTGWHTVKYDFVEGKYLYNRCHLIGYQLSGENANERNLITGTRYLNVQGMLPFENMVADYVKETNNHVMYRVTPVFEGDNLLAKGVKIEAYSVEDKGAGICFNVFCYNIQPGVCINYATGDSYPDNTGETSVAVTDTTAVVSIYILNKGTKKFHRSDCPSVNDIKESNKESYSGRRDALITHGYVPCKNCNP